MVQVMGRLHQHLGGLRVTPSRSKGIRKAGDRSMESMVRGGTLLCSNFQGIGILAGREGDLGIWGKRDGKRFSLCLGMNAFFFF